MNASVTKPENVSLEDTPASRHLIFSLGSPESLPKLEGFELLEEIGRGGMGFIYRARDLALDRDIAIKFLQSKYEITSISGLRFVEEARITGQLQHPGIPAVHQVGQLTDGRPYLVMKLIKGYALNELIWKKQRREPDAEVTPYAIPSNFLSIFEAICQAVGYAHAHQVIHRDLKPHNIMVGAFGEVQVMDWGLAKVIQPGNQEPVKVPERQESQLTVTMAPSTKISSSSSHLTVAGSILGTPGYMPPEQALGANEMLDTRSDVFGLGAILATLLTGKPPFEGDTPESIRVQAALGMIQPCFERLDSCGADPDLVKLAKRCLSLQPGDRPPNGGEIAKEIAQLRAAAEARAQQAELERAKAEVHAEEQRQRWRVGLIASAVVVSVLLVGITATTWGLLRASAKEQEASQSAVLERQARVAEAQQRDRAVTKEAETQSILDFVLYRVIAAARPENLEGGKGRDVKLRDALESSLKMIADEFSEKPLIEARLCHAIGQSFWFLGDYPLAEKLLTRARELAEKHLGTKDKQTIKTVLVIANVQESQGKHQQALQLRESAYQSCLQTIGVDDHLTQMAMNNLSASYQRLGRKADVFKLREEVVKLTKAHLGITNPFTLISMANLAISYFDQGQHDEAIRLLKEAVALEEQHLGIDHVHTLATKHNLADCLNQLGQYPAAMQILQEVVQKRQEKLGADHPDTLNSMMIQAFCFMGQGKKKEALELLKTALPLNEKRLGVDHPQTLLCLRNIVTNLFDDNRSSEALPFIEQCLARTQHLPVHQELESVMYLLRFRHHRQQRSMPECVATLAEWEKLVPLDPENTFEVGLAWAMLSTLRQELEPATGVAEADKAMVYIQQASDRGWKVLATLETAKELDKLRKRDDCRLLIEKLRKTEKK